MIGGSCHRPNRRHDSDDDDDDDAYLCITLFINKVAFSH